MQWDRSIQLERKLQLMLGSKNDVLMEYREWLDINGVPAETDGWPSTEAYQDHNINLFVRQKRTGKIERGANDNA
jgi:hypothetical protein